MSDSICNEDFFEKIDSEKKAYWLGFLLADGWAHKNNNSIGIELASVDMIHLEKFKKDLKIKKEIQVRERNGGKYCLLFFSSKKMRADLEKHGFVPNKSKKVLFPNDIPSQFKRDLIRGYFDGDGWISRWKNGKYDRIEFGVLASEEFLKDVSEILPHKIRIGYVKKSNLFAGRLSSKKQVLENLDFLYSGCSISLDRKEFIYNELRRK